MAHFAQLDENNIVTQVLVVDNRDVGELPFPDSELIGVQFLTNLFPGTRWAQTSYNHNFRMRYAGVGYKFLPGWGDSGAFASPQPFPSFTWDDTICNWIAPIPYPTDGLEYVWDEEKQMWTHARTQMIPTTVIG